MLLGFEHFGAKTTIVELEACSISPVWKKCKRALVTSSPTMDQFYLKKVSCVPIRSRSLFTIERKHNSFDLIIQNRVYKSIISIRMQ